MTLIVFSVVWSRKLCLNAGHAIIRDDEDDVEVAVRVVVEVAVRVTWRWR